MFNLNASHSANSPLKALSINFPMCVYSSISTVQYIYLPYSGIPPDSKLFIGGFIYSTVEGALRSDRIVGGRTTNFLEPLLKRRKKGERGKEHRLE